MKRLCLKHPRLRRPITPARFVKEFAGLIARARRRGFRFNYTIVFLASMHELHCRNARRFAQVDVRKRVFEFAPEVLFLSKQFRTGLAAHEIGHVLAGSRGSEADADSAAATWLGVQVGYDRRGFPGKGLQRSR